MEKKFFDPKKNFFVKVISIFVVVGQAYSTSPEPSQRNRHFYPGGVVAGRPVPQGWYSEPWWRPALVAGAWGVGSALLFCSLFIGMSGVAPGLFPRPTAGILETCGV
jgi:hypothetical protein